MTWFAIPTCRRTTVTATRLVLISDDQICISRSQITNDSAPFETLFGCQTTSHDNSSAKQNWFCFLNKGLGGSGWLRGKRKGSAREHCQRKVQICFSRQDRFWLWAPFLPCDSYVMFIKLACITGAKWSETNGAFGAAALLYFDSCVVIIYNRLMLLKYNAQWKKKLMHTNRLSK